jgi:hypothetical protein
VFEPLEGIARGVFPGGHDDQDRVQAVAGASVESELALPQRREHVAGKLHYEGLSLQHLQLEGRLRVEFVIAKIGNHRPFALLLPRYTH